MKAFVILVIAVLLGVGSYVLCFRSATAPMNAMLTQPAGELEWLRREFRLTDAQFERIKTMHRDYSPKCDAMCEKIAQTNGRLEALIGSEKAVTPALRAAVHDSAVAQEECRQSLLAHVYAVSAEMSPEQGARYVAMMKPRLIEQGLHADALIAKTAR
ncbi:MAG: periplasmic heavy metal sensor [Chthoniobacteraceae bacterium]